MIKCQHFVNVSYFYVYMHMEKLLLFKINTTKHTVIVNIEKFFFTDFLTQGGKIARNLPEILGTEEHVLINGLISVHPFFNH